MVGQAPFSKGRVTGASLKDTGPEPHMENVTEKVKPPVFVQNIPEAMNRDETASIWKTYVEESDAHDEKDTDKWDQTLETFLLFAALFSAIVTAFLILSLGQLGPDNVSATLDALTVISQQLHAGSSSAAMPPAYVAPSFSPSNKVLWVNGLFLASLILSLVASVIAMLARQWLRVYREDLDSRSCQRARQRQFRYNGLMTWRVPGIINALPLLIHIAVFLFLLGMYGMLTSTSPVLAWVVAGLTIAAAFLYIIVTITPFFLVSCPYRSSLTSLIDSAWARGVACMSICLIGLRICWSGLTALRFLPRKRFYAAFAEKFPSLDVPDVPTHHERVLLTIDSQKEHLDASSLSWLLASCPDPQVQRSIIFVLSTWHPSEIFTQGHSRANRVEHTTKLLVEDHLNSIGRLISNPSAWATNATSAITQLHEMAILAAGTYLKGPNWAPHAPLPVRNFLQHLCSSQDTSLRSELLAFTVDVPIPSKDDLERVTWLLQRFCATLRAGNLPVVEACLVLRVAQACLRDLGLTNDVLKHTSIQKDLLELVESSHNLPSSFLFSVIVFWSNSKAPYETAPLSTDNPSDLVATFLDEHNPDGALQMKRAVVVYVKNNPAMFVQHKNKMISALSPWLIFSKLHSDGRETPPDEADIEVDIHGLALQAIGELILMDPGNLDLPVPAWRTLLRAMDLSSELSHLLLLALRDMCRRRKSQSTVAEILQTLCAEMMYRREVQLLYSVFVCIMWDQQKHARYFVQHIGRSWIPIMHRGIDYLFSHKHWGIIQRNIVVITSSVWPFTPDRQVCELIDKIHELWSSALKADAQLQTDLGDIFGCQLKSLLHLKRGTRFRTSAAEDAGMTQLDVISTDQSERNDIQRDASGWNFIRRLEEGELQGRENDGDEEDGYGEDGKESGGEAEPLLEDEAHAAERSPLEDHVHAGSVEVVQGKAIADDVQPSDTAAEPSGQATASATSEPLKLSFGAHSIVTLRWDKHTLETRNASCPMFVTSTLDLDKYIGNRDGQLSWGDADFSHSCYNPRLNGTSLRASARRADRTWNHTASIDLSDLIRLDLMGCLEYSCSIPPKRLASSVDPEVELAQIMSAHQSDKRPVGSPWIPLGPGSVTILGADGHTLESRNPLGDNFVKSTLDLNSIIGNEEGTLRWGGVKFSETCFDIKVEGTTLRVGSAEKSNSTRVHNVTLELSDHIRVGANGYLQYY